MKPNRILLLVLLLSSATFAAPKIKIGIVNSITGPEAPIGETMTNGYKLAAEDLKKKGIEIDLISEDDTGKPQVALSAQEKLVTRDDVAAIVGPYPSSSANAMAKKSEQSKVPMLIPAASKEDITKQGYKYVFRLNAPSSEYSLVVLEAALHLGPAKTVAVVYENTDFGTAAAKTMRDQAKERKLEIVADESYSKGSPDYRSTLSQIKGKNPDLVFMVSYVADAILLMRQAREMGLSPKAFLGGGAGFTTNQFAEEKAISENVMSSTQWTEDGKWPGAPEWAARYRKVFGKEPTYHAACAYEALRIMGEVANAAGGSREKIREGLKAGKWSGIMGDVKFEDYDGFTGQNKHKMLVVQIQKGKYVTVAPPEFAAGKAVYPFPGWK